MSFEFSPIYKKQSLHKLRVNALSCYRDNFCHIGIALQSLDVQSKTQEGPYYYRNVYLKSDAWKRKRFVVLKRDDWECGYCGARATQVHHKRYARKNIGKEPIKWLVSVCASCHESLHE